MLNESKILFKIPEYGAHWIYTCLNNEPAKNLKTKVSRTEENFVKCCNSHEEQGQKKNTTRWQKKRHVREPKPHWYALGVFSEVMKIVKCLILSKCNVNILYFKILTF